LWLAFRLGRASRRQRLGLMARQTLVGYQYALLQNQSSLTWFPTVDYFTTRLFRNLLDTAFAAIDINSTDSSKLSAFGFCLSADIVLLLISHDETETIDVSLDDFLLLDTLEKNFSQSRLDFILAPNWQGDPSDPSRYKLTAASATLNGIALSDPFVNFTELATLSNYKNKIHLEPLTFGLFQFPIQTTTAAVLCSNEHHEQHEKR